MPCDHMPGLAVEWLSMKTSSRSYSELIKLDSFQNRFEYTKLPSRIGDATFGFERYLNQLFYTSQEWRRFRREMIVRDNGMDLGLDGYDIFGRIEVHHLNPITIEDIENVNPCLMDPENVICVSSKTHKAIHFGSSDLLVPDIVERRPNDMCPWLIE